MMQTLVGARVAIVRKIPIEPLCVSADTNQFDTALVNLAVDARDAMSGEGKLTISVRATDMMPPQRERTAVRGSFVAITIEDTGTGIPEADRERIFEPSTRPSRSGREPASACLRCSVSRAPVRR